MGHISRISSLWQFFILHGPSLRRRVADDETKWREDRHSLVPSGGQRGIGQAGLLRGGSQ